MEKRLDYLDGHRGLAILLVLGFHAYSRWTSILPHGETYEKLPFFNFGWLGVQLFFLLSGFVIFMTLDRTGSFKTFIFKRFLRLFPAMLIVCIFIYITLPLFTERPTDNPSLLSLLPSLTFTEPSWWSSITGVEINSLEGAFWSLYVEFKFYIIASFIYYFLGRVFLIPSLMLLFFSAALLALIPEESHSFLTNIAFKISHTLSFEHFGWFCSGACFYLFHQTKQESYFLIAILVALINSLLVAEGNTHEFFASTLLFLLFAFSLRSNIIQRILSLKLFLFFGFISYPLYLIHENTMISIIIQAQEYISWMHPIFYPFFPVALLSLISHMISKEGEPWIKQKLELMLAHIGSWKGRESIFVK